MRTGIVKEYYIRSGWIFIDDTLGEYEEKTSVFCKIINFSLSLSDINSKL